MIKIYFVIFAAVLTLNISSCTRATDIKKQHDTGTVVNISLPKKVYKEYEPIELLYEWINLKDKPDTIWSLTSQDYIKYFIFDDKGNQYGNKMMVLDVAGGPEYIVKKGDTLKKTITLNHFGKQFSEKLDEEYFNCLSYFPPGKYKVYSLTYRDLIREYPEPIKTNELGFEVEEPETNDKSILALVQKEKYEEALKLYPSNYFEEYIMNSEISKHVLEFIRTGDTYERYKHASVLPVKYDAFFEKYPNSLYNLNDMYIVRYLSFSSQDSAGIELKMIELLNKYPGTNISRTVTEIKNKQRTGYHYSDLKYDLKRGRNKIIIPKPEGN